ncbi:hypothetical protein BCR41DRAFT_420592 [Lobosporangium transversale]|uniref:Zn(2)-C6 fungal-type domain-containing protein n=1 Tax=Lobosporangium transversale TaxID=64571 RepID=A0A1Y2GV43_9FUNG|nr:hypothetical protein BCR41DRAFT_420592 [Lobosporangium transversale]ORZ22832.1 hypothetical protein BCR41DRAFT_420592 [Lobosporangium transversale]|eukprot:XP_021883386.1 hypothetical protein BCR41DRAFT_420592 [Lobosporangium transversale]
MTFSGLLIVRDPKQSCKGGVQSSTSPSFSTTTSPTSATAKSPQLEQQQSSKQYTASSSRQDLNRRSTSPTLNTISAKSTNGSEMASDMLSMAKSTNITASDASQSTIPTSQLSSPPSSSSMPSMSLMESPLGGLVQVDMVNTSMLLEQHSIHATEATSTAQLTSSTSASLTLSPLTSSMDMQQRQQIPTASPIATPIPTSTLTSSKTSSIGKKKGAPQNLSPAHSAAYRKRLNVNQVCDWCRYRKIRCDRESPCNSCQHSKRECVRTPPSVLLSRSNAANAAVAASAGVESSPSSPITITNKTKRSRVDTKDVQSPRGNKSYRSSSISSYHSSSYTSYSSDQDENDEHDDAASTRSGSTKTGASSVSPVVGSLTLAGLGLGSLAGVLDTSSNDMQLDTPPVSSSFPNAAFALGQTQAPTMQGGSESGAWRPSSVPQDQETLERMRRIELLLSSVIPGAAEFITNGANGSQLLQHQQRQASPHGGRADKKPLSVITQGLNQLQQRDMTMSPMERLSNISLASPAVKDSSSMQNNVHEEKLNLQQLQQQQNHQSPLDYAERMKRIEMLLVTVQDLPIAKALIGQSQDISQSSRSKDGDIQENSRPQKKMPKKYKSDPKKNLIINSNGQVVKRPHVAAGFAGQKPPPKLPQAIAEAAQKKQGARKKRTSAAATRATTANASANANTNAEKNSSTARAAREASVKTMTSEQAHESIKPDLKTVTPSPTASLEIPSAIGNENIMQFDPNQTLMMPQHDSYHRGSIPVAQQQPQPQQHSSYRNYQQQFQLPMTNTASMTIPLNTIGTYESLVVPASSSPASSVASSPRSAKAEPVIPDGSLQGKNMGDMELNDSRLSSLGLEGSQIEHQYAFMQQQHPIHSFSGDQFQAGFDFASESTSQQQQQTFHPHLSQQHGAIAFPQHAAFSDFGLDMDESLEALMKKDVVGPLGGITGNLADSSSTTLLQGHHGSTPFNSAIYDNQFGFFQQQQQQQQQQPSQSLQQQMDYQDVLGSMWTSGQTGSFSVPAHNNPQNPWSHQSSQSINISADDSSQPEMELKEGQSQEQPQQQMNNAHALFQQQFQQQRRHQHQQQEQMRKNSIVLGMHQHLQQQQRTSIPHQLQQTFYIPQNHDDDDDDDDDEGGLQTLYDGNKINNIKSSTPSMDA